MAGRINRATWQNRWYGENRSFLHKCVTNGLLFGSLTCYYAVWIDFLPSEFWWRWGTITTVVLALVVTAVLYRGFATGQLRSAPQLGGWRRVVAYSILPFVVFGIFWMIFVRVVPDVAARAAGRPAQVTGAMKAVYSVRRSMCDYRLEGEVLTRALPVDYVCIAESEYPALQSETPVTLVGRETLLGMHIDGYVH